MGILVNKMFLDALKMKNVPRGERLVLRLFSNHFTKYKFNKKILSYFFFRWNEIKIISEIEHRSKIKVMKKPNKFTSLNVKRVFFLLFVKNSKCLCGNIRDQGLPQ